MEERIQTFEEKLTLLLEEAPKIPDSRLLKKLSIDWVLSAAIFIELSKLSLIRILEN